LSASAAGSTTAPRRAAPWSGTGLFLLAAATATLAIVSRGRWSDALIDSGREWIVPDALSRGALLYRDVVYWFGPFTPYLHAALFRVFGSGFGTLVAAGAVACAALVAALFFALRRVTGRREAALWCAFAIPSLLFMPNAGGALLGMGYRIWHAAFFVLLTVTLASGAPAREGMAVRPILAGVAAALAGLCRTEWGAAAAAAGLLAAFWRPRSVRRGLADAAALGAAFLVVFGGAVAAFVAAAGRAAVLDEGHLLFARLPAETRNFLVHFSGIRDWPRGLAELLYSLAMWTGAFFLVETLALGKDALRRRAPSLAGIVVVLAASALAGGAGESVLWSAAPAVSLIALGASLARGRGRGGRRAALAAFGFLGLVLCYRRVFHIGDSAYTGPPLLFAFACGAGLLRRRVERLAARPARERVRAAFAAVLVFATAAMFAGRLARFASWEASPIAGTHGFLTDRAEVAREIEGLAGSIRAGTPRGSGLVVFPEGELLNFLSGRPNPIRHMLYLPGYLTDDNEDEVLRELQAHPPGAVVIWRRPLSEYRRALFGYDFAKKIRAWIDRNYAISGYRAPGAPARTNPRFEWGPRRAEAAP
jgi:hypothetical protein